MEEVGKDITPSCNLHNEIHTTPPLSLQQHPRTNTVLQDFLSGAPFKDQVTPPPPPPPPLPQTPIDLNLMGSASNLDPNSHPFSICPKNRLLDHQQQQMMKILNVGRFGVNVIINDEDRKQKRMMKNRQSAARSRARKQAYINQLELEVAHLVQENAKLREQFEKLRSVMAAQFPAKKALRRSSSSSF